MACSIAEGGGDGSAAPADAAPMIGTPNPNGAVAGAGCTSGNDCRSGVCASSLCQAAQEGDKGGETPPGENDKPGVFDNGIKDGTETDVDCGGPAEGPRCGAGKACKVHEDCASTGCAFDGTCAARASCTQLEGGQTCGADESMTKQNDCCESAKVGSATVDKYLITAGRMRAFLTRLDGKVRDWAAALPKDRWNQGHTTQLPNSMDGEPGDGENANSQLGPFFGKRSCQTGSHTGHTFWTPQQYGDTKDFSREVLDTKALNCVPWWLAAALCAFDGGHLITEAELKAAYTNAGSSTYPWGARGSYTSSAQNDFAIQEFVYATPGSEPGANGYLDAAGHIAPPGRRPDGYNKTGHTDLVGNLLEWVGDSERQFVWKGSFERHAFEADKILPPINNDPYLARNPQTFMKWYWHTIGAPDGNPNGYYALGGRCAY
jgi:hypothetical protein